MVDDSNPHVRVVSVGEADPGLASVDVGATFEVVEVEDAEQCLDAIAERDVDCVLSRYILPETDGIDLLASVREDHPDLPFVLCVEEARTQVLEAAVEAGVTDHVPAAVTPETLADRLRARLREQEAAERYRNLVEASPAPINVFDADGEVRYCNEAVRELVGVADRADLVGRSVFEFVHEDDAATAEAELRAVVEEKRSVGPTQMTVVTEEGEHRDIQVATAPGRYRGEDVGQAVITDVTELRETERELAETAERYRNLVESSPVPIALVDEDGDVVLGNDALRALLGIDDGELAGRSMLEFAVGGDRERSRARLERVVRRKERAEPTRMEIERCDGARRHVQVSTAPGTYRGEPVGQVVLTDVTELRETERELRAERRFVEDALDALQDVFYVVDTEGRVARWNEEAVTATGYDPAELEGMPIEDLFVGEDVERVTDSYRTTMAEGSDVVEARLLARDGQTLPFEFRSQRLTDEDGETVGLVGIGRNISDRRAWERERARQQERLETLNATNEILRDVNAALVTAESREEIERTVCEQFAADGPYRLAWIGAPDQGHHRIVPRAWAGVERGYLDTIEITLDESETGGGPGALAVRTGEVQVMNVRDAAFAPWREAALQRGYESVVGIPITYEGATYGVLLLYDDRADGIEYLDEDVLAGLGRTIGYAINASERKRALLADDAVALELSLSDPAEFFCRFSEALDCAVSLEKVSPLSDGSYNVFLTVATDDAARIDETCERFRSVTSWTHLADRAGEHTVEVRVTGTLVVDLLATHGGVVCSLTAEDGRCELTVELPTASDVRSLVETLRASYSDVSLLARRERAGRNRPRLGLQLEELLTERQQEVLETAYFSGYFEASREQSGTDLAELLGISGPTFHHHLRASQRRLLAELLGPSDGG